MANVFQAAWPVTSENAEFTHKASEACNVGDLLYYDTTNNVLRSASNFTDGGSAGITQGGFAVVFAGISNSQQLSSDGTARNCRLIIDEIREMTCTSGTFTVGDYVTIAYSAGLVNQTVVKTTDPSLAIGRVVKRYASATTLVKVRLTSRLFNGPLLKDKLLSVAAVTAVGQNIACANALTGEFNLVTPGAAGTGVQLPAPTPGRRVIVKYNGAVASGLGVYPHTGGIINNGSANANVLCGNNTTIEFIAYNTVAWYSFPGNTLAASV